MAELLNAGRRGATRTTVPITLEVNVDTGDDANPGTLAAPLKSIIEAEDRIPDVVDDDVIINVAGSATQYGMPTFRHRILRADIFVTSTDYTTQAGVGATGTADAASTTEKLVFGPGGMTVDAFRSMWVVFDSGPNAGDERSINENTAGDIIPSRPFSAAPDATSTYRVVRPAAIWTAPDPGQVLVDGGLVIRGQGSGLINPGSPAHWFHGFGIDASLVTASSSAIVCRNAANFFMIDTGFSSKRISVKMQSGMVGVTSGASSAAVIAGLITSLSEWDGNGWGADLTGGFLEITGTASNSSSDPQPVFVVVVGSTLSLGDAAIFGGDLRRSVASGNSPLLISGRCFVFGPSPTLPIKLRAVSVGLSVGRLSNPQFRDTAEIVFCDIDVTNATSGVAILNDGYAVVRAGTYVSADIAIQNRKGVVELVGASTIVAGAADKELSFDGVTGFPASDISGARDSVDDGISTFFRSS